jgi:hypothetical protein
MRILSGPDTNQNPIRSGYKWGSYQIRIQMRILSDPDTNEDPIRSGLLWTNPGPNPCDLFNEPTVTFSAYILVGFLQIKLKSTYFLANLFGPPRIMLCLNMNILGGWLFGV